MSFVKETMDMDETSTPADFLDHEPSKQEKQEVRFFWNGTRPLDIIERKTRVEIPLKFLFHLLRCHSLSQ